MAEIILSLEPEGLLTTTQLHSKGREVSGYLVDPGISLSTQRRDAKTSNKPNFVKNVLHACNKLEAKTVILDPRLIQDKPEKIDKEVKFYLDHHPKLADDKTRNVINRYKPTHLTVDYYANRASMQQFIESCAEFDVIPVCFTTSSRSTDQDYDDRDTTPEEFAKKSTDVITQIGFTAVMCAAADAPIVRSVNPKLTVIATGGALDLSGDLHPRHALIEETRDFVDYFVFGSSVYEKPDPLAAYDARYSAVRS